LLAVLNYTSMCYWVYFSAFE